MTPYTLQFIPKEDLALFSRIRTAIERLDDLDLGTDENGDSIILSCHMLARAVAKVFPVAVRDGYFIQAYDHSWVATQSGHIIDVYPIGVIGGPILIDGDRCSPLARTYILKPTKKISRGRFGKPSFRQSVRRITDALNHT